MDAATQRRLRSRISAAIFDIELQAIEAELWGFWTDFRVLVLRQEIEARRRELAAGHAAKLRRSSRTPEGIPGRPLRKNND